ncbi:MAG: hypothetical protein L6437_00070 [Kiritimatiellae bacterium]|nr:hypothetical protein [Kiritimatiellia bacterium]
MFFVFSARIIKALLVLIFVISIMGVMSSFGLFMRHELGRPKIYSRLRYADLNSGKNNTVYPSRKELSQYPERIASIYEAAVNDAYSMAREKTASRFLGFSVIIFVISLVMLDSMRKPKLTQNISSNKVPEPTSAPQASEVQH